MSYNKDMRKVICKNKKKTVGPPLFIYSLCVPTLVLRDYKFPFHKLISE